MTAGGARKAHPGTILLGLVAASLLGWALANSPVFSTRSILIRGLERLDPADIRRLAGVELGANLLRISLDRVAGSLERDPRVADATASRSLPSTLVITVAERRPVGWLRDPRGRVVVADDGVVLERPEISPREVPWLGRAPSPLGPGFRLSEPPITLEVARALADAVLAKVRTITFADSQIMLVLRNGGEVLYGAAERFGDKGRAVDSMLRWADREGIDVASIDVRIPESPTLRPAP